MKEYCHKISRFWMIHRIVLLLIGGVVVLTTPQVSFGTMTDLGTLGGNSSQGFGINDQGQIVGYSDNDSGELHAFLWQNSTMTDLGTLGGDFSCAKCINDLAQIVGNSRTESGELHAFFWQNGTMTDLGTLGGNSSYGEGINDQGQIVGYSDNESGEIHAFLWKDGTMTDLGALGGKYGADSFATDINDQGQIVGYSDNESGEDHAVLWKNGTMTDLGTLGGKYSFGFGINDLGQIAGYSYIELVTTHAFFWENGTMTDLGGTPGEDCSKALGINNHGQIIVVGYAESGYRHAFLWENMPPIANAGLDQTVNEGISVTLNGSNSTDPDDGIACFQWTQTDGSVVTLLDASAVQSTFTAPDVELGRESLTFQLTVTDNGGLQDTDTCVVTVTAKTGDGGTGEDGGDGGCFIATAAYAFPMEPHVKLLREFRDGFFLVNTAGRTFVEIYYTYSPPFADFIAKHDSLQALVRYSLLPLVGMSWVALNFASDPSLVSMILLSAGLMGNHKGRS